MIRTQAVDSRGVDCQRLRSRVKRPGLAVVSDMDYANAGSGYEMDAIAAVVVGGTSMAGGRGTILGTVFGMLIIAVMNNMLNLLGVPPFLREAFKGFIVVAAVLLQRKEKG